jgi:hypothetical protein
VDGEAPELGDPDGAPVDLHRPVIGTPAGLADRGDPAGLAPADPEDPEGLAPADPEDPEVVGAATGANTTIDTSDGRSESATVALYLRTASQFLLTPNAA